jgi:predicted DNA-binding transcriptional regulator AlpA
MADIIHIADRGRDALEERRHVAVRHCAPPPDRVRPLREIAQFSNMSLSTLRRLIKDGRGPRVVQVSPRRSGVTDLDFLIWLEGCAK